MFTKGGGHGARLARRLKHGYAREMGLSSKRLEEDSASAPMRKRKGHERPKPLRGRIVEQQLFLRAGGGHFSRGNSTGRKVATGVLKSLSENYRTLRTYRKTRAGVSNSAVG